MSTTFFNATPEHARRCRCKAVWESGDFGLVAKYNEPAASEFMARLPLRPGQRVLDLACGTGNLAMLAARAGCLTSGLDIATNLIAQARRRAEAEGLPLEFTEGDAEALPYPDGCFDFVLSMFGVPFAPRPEIATAQLLRVCRTGGGIALANWTMEGLLGETFGVINRHVPSPTSLPSPFLWGDEGTMRARLACAVSELRLTRRRAKLRYPFTPRQTVEFFRQFYGPTLRAFAGLDSAGQGRLQADLEELFSTHNHSRDGTTELAAEYLEVVATRA